MKVFLKKRAVWACVLSLLLVAVLAVALPIMAAETEDFYGVNVSTSGTVSLNFFYTSLGEADSVCIVERNSAGEEVSTTVVGLDEIPTDDDGRYVISARLAAAEMTSFVTVYTQKNGVKLGESHTYTVKGYAEQVLEREDYADYHPAIRAMLNYGAMAQAHFGTNADSPANAGIYRSNTNPVSAVTSVDCAEPSWVDGTTLKFTGYEAVLESSTAFRIYFTYSGVGTPAATVEREGLEAQDTAVYYDEANDRYYVRINNIAATLYAKQYTVKVTDGSDSLSVTAGILNYVDTVLSSEETTDTQKNAVRAMYNHYVWTAKAAPAVTSCAHGYIHEESVKLNSASAYVCSTCGVEVKTVADRVDLFMSPMELLSTYTSGWDQTGELMTDEDGTVFARIHGGSSVADKYNTLYFYGDGSETGKYLVLKYRLPSDNTTAQPYIYWYSKSKATGSSWAKTSISAPQDDEWHTVVVDLDQVTDDSTGFMPSADGKYYSHCVWFRPLSCTEQGTVEDSMDIAYIAMCNELDDVSALVDEEKYERHLSLSSSTLVTTATNECDAHHAVETLSGTTCSYECGFCEKDLGSFELTDINYFCSPNDLAIFGVTSSRPIGDHYSYSTTLCEEDGVVFAKMLYNSEHGGGAGHVYAHGGYLSDPGACEGSTGRFLVMKIRTTGNTSYVLEITSKPAEKDSASEKTSSSSKKAVSLGTANQWETVVVDLSAYADYSVYDTSADAGISCRITSSGSVVDVDHIDIAYLAVVDDLGEAQQIIGADTTYNYYATKESWATTGVTCNTSTMSCQGECVKAVNTLSVTGGKYYTYSCATCGHYYSERQFVSSDINWFRSANALYSAYYTDSRSFGVDDDGTLFVRMNGAGGSDSYNSLYLGNPGTSLSVGKYYVVKYRLRSDNPTSNTTQHVYLKSYSVTNAKENDYTAAIYYQVHQDDEWHTAVIDLSKHPEAANYIADETDGLYHLSSLWMRPLTVPGSAVPLSTAEDYIDYAYAAMCDSVEDLKSLIDQDTYEIHTGNATYTVVDTDTGECITHNYIESGSDNAYVYSCSGCGHVADFDVDRYFTVNTMDKAEAYKLNKTVITDSVSGDRFVRYYGQGTPGQVNPFRFPIYYSNKSDGTQSVNTSYGKGTPFNIGTGDKYLIIKYRTNSTDWEQYMYLGTKDANTTALGDDGLYTGSTNKVDVKLPMSSITANEWQIIVIDMASALGSSWVANSDGEYVIETLQFHSDNVPASTHFDVAYYAFVDSWEDIAYVTGADEAILVDSASGTGGLVNAADGSCVEGGCSITESNDGTTYKTYCSACGKVYAEKNIADANKFVSAKEISGYTTLFFTHTLQSEYNEETMSYESYTRHTHDWFDDAGNSKNTEGHVYFFGNHVSDGLLTIPIEKAGQYLVLKFRTFGVSKLTLNARTGDAAFAGSLVRTTGLNSGWETAVIDLSPITSYTVGATDTTFTIRLRIFRAAISDPLQTLDVSYAAIVDSIDEAVAITGSGDVNLYDDWSASPVTYTKTDVECSGSVLGHTMASASCTSDRVCDVCGITYAGAAGHIYTETATPEYLATRATDDAKATFYKSCSCGAISEETFESGKTISETYDLTKADRYNTLKAGITNGESFLYFTDPHYVEAAENGTIRYAYEYAIDIMSKYYGYAGASFALSGGDWLNSSNTRESAIANLKDIDARMQAAFGKNYYLVLGNHDYNYQTKNADGSATVQSPHWLTREEIDGAWYSDERYGGKSYYSFSGENTKFYVFDSGIDWSHSAMNDFDITQVEWFLTELLSNDDAHIALAPHILYTSEMNLHPATEKILEFSQTYNQRGTVSFNGKLYDFSGKTGYVEFLIAGHSHRDEVSVYNDIPCILTVNNGSSCPSFELIAVDYDARVINLVRVNSGTAENAATLDRTVDLYAIAE